MSGKVFERAARLESLNLPFAMATIIGSKGSVPRRSARALIEADGTVVSTLGGHSVEEAVKDYAVEAIREGKNRVVSVKAGKGEARVMIDVIKAKKDVHIIGFGHLGQAMARLFHTLGYAVYTYDIIPHEMEGTINRVGETWQEALKDFCVDEKSAVIITVHGADAVLPLIDAGKAFYVGLVSSRMKVLSNPEGYKNIQVPMGLDVAAQTPEELAVAVAAEVMKFYAKRSGKSLKTRLKHLVVVRGGGDLATATIIRLFRAGYDVVVLEIEKPTQVRRNVSLAEAIWEGSQTVDGVTAVRVDEEAEIFHTLDENKIPVVVDPEGKLIEKLHPFAVVDAIIAKKNLGTNINMAPLTIALGPGFEAGVDVDVVIETQRGHNLGRIIRKGRAAENTGVPGVIGGYGKERVIKSSCEGVFKGLKTFGDIVKAGETVATVNGVPQCTLIDGMVRGMLHDDLYVSEGFKIADIDPRGEKVEYRSPSDKARCIAGGVLEVVDSWRSGEDM